MSSNDLQTNKIQVYLTDDELGKLQRIKNKTKTSYSQIMRDSFNNSVLMEMPSEDYMEVVIQLRRIGNNLNQLVRLAHSGEWDLNIERLEIALKENKEVGKYLMSVSQEKTLVSDYGND